MAEIRSRVLAIGGYVPPNVVTNHDFKEKLGIDTSHEWIVERTGIEQRHWATPEDSGAKMAANATREALEKAGREASDIDMIVYATLSPDHTFPGTGVFLQRELGLGHIPCVDIRQQCTGFIYALSIADSFIRTGQYKTVLVIGSEIHSTGLDKTTNGRDVSVLFGDGAGAALLGVADDDSHQILSSHLYADGSEAEILWTDKPGSRYHPRITKDDIDEGRHYPAMQGRKVFKHAVTRMPEAIKAGLKANGLTLDDIDCIIPHQANLRINEFIAQSFKLPPERIHNNIQKYGNTTAASIPLCMREAIEIGKIKPGSLVCLVAFGAGLTWGSVFLRY
ncbi:3-oxoacyl-ACP synthase III family protein [Haliangium ochraceum]|uniref:Beta-ketoacyl-[acyl-carrier-protein] synthase III n=1 Tax=Haliangium ochraceum (strain DSM 14365 / JCM 11303 / SMP-2) TaxID=502025 RepID=D0LFL3_HALO1|nr:beta-ketoacyl-ACP synthase III [Haliangium ochraceum]ACY12647.1 3-oxoacyl-(acyl-carrier-protein) synthase III [Haliangium ochraceum DSM 14365]